MKAAIVYNAGEAPKYSEVPEPIPANEKEVLVTMKAVAIAGHEKSVASGKHYSAKPLLKPAIPGTMGVGVLKDGTRIFGVGINGVLAEKVLMNIAQMVKLPDGIDDITAAALPNAVIGSALALLFRAKFKPGEVVLINGATGFTGTLAVQLARHYGAKKIIATGRNTEQLQLLLSMGADEIISLKDSKETIIENIKATAQKTPVDIVLDYTWGQPAECILTAFSGKGGFTNHLRYVSIGATTGNAMQLSASLLRSSNIEIMGSGLGSLPKEAFQKLFSEVLPEVYGLVVAGKLKIETVTANLKDIETTFQQEVPPGKRLVIVI